MYHDKGSIMIEEPKKVSYKKHIVAGLLLGTVGTVAYLKSGTTTAATKLQAG